MAEYKILHCFNDLTMQFETTPKVSHICRLVDKHTFNFSASVLDQIQAICFLDNSLYSYIWDLKE